MKETPEPVTRWHQEPLAWLVFGLPLGTVFACALLYAIASRHSDSLVVDDYYKRGLEINKRLDREAEASRLGLSVVGVTLRDGLLEFTLTATDIGNLPDTLDVRLAHATRGQEDQILLARHAGAGRYVSTPTQLDPGPWYVDISTPAWRIVTRHLVAALPGSKGSDSIALWARCRDQKGQTRLLGYGLFSRDKTMAEQSSLTLLIPFDRRRSQTFPACLIAARSA